MKDVQVTFVNSVAVSGHLNGIINLALATANFLPGASDEKGERKVEVAESIAVNLRFDLYCAQQIHKTLGELIAQQTKPAAKEVN